MISDYLLPKERRKARQMLSGPLGCEPWHAWKYPNGWREDVIAISHEDLKPFLLSVRQEKRQSSFSVGAVGALKNDLTVS